MRKERCFMKNAGMREEDISEIHSLTMKQFNLLIKLKGRVSGEEYIILESIIFDFSLP